MSVQVVPPAGIYLTDYYSGTRDRLVVTLINRDNQQPVANVKLRVVIRNSSVFELRSREELYYPMLTLESGVPLRLTSMDLQPYLAPDRVAMNGYLENGRLPNGMTEFRVQALDYTTGRVLSEVAVGRVWLESKQPPLLSQPSKNDLVALRNPQHLRFQWTPRHQGLAQTEYEFVLKELPDNGVPPQTAFLYGPEIYRTDTRRTTLDYGTMEPPLEPGKKYGWQVRAKALDGVDEIGVFDNRGYSEIIWFEVSDNCPEVTQLKATAGFRRIDLSWHHHPDQNAFVVQWRPKTQSSMYEWESATVFDASHTLTQLQEGWTYEYRVGALCIRDTPVFGLGGQVTLPEKNEERLKNCGKVPTIDLTNEKPNENLKVGDIVTIGGDFPMRVDEVTAQGNGWYSGKGGLVLPWVFEIGVNVEFARLRVNTDNVQIDGEVETVYDQEESLIGNTNELDYGGSTLEPGGIGFPPVPVDFTVPPLAQASYDESTGELTIADEDGGNPQTVTIPKNGAKSSFPIEIVDAEGNRYQIDLPQNEEAEASEEQQAGGSSTESGASKERPRPTITKIEGATGTINTKGLSKEAGFNVRFTAGGGKYAFDEGREAWYQRAKLVCNTFYKPFGEHYIAPWKLVPVGQTDQVDAVLAGAADALDKLDRSKVKFVTADGKGVAAKDEGTKWVLTVPATGAGQTDDIFAVYEKSKNRPLTVGKLRVVSYAVQHHTVTLVPVGVDSPDGQAAEAALNKIYAPYGVEFTVKVDEAIKDLAGWQGRTFQLEGNGFFTRENADMAEIRKAYQAERGSSKEGYCVFVLGAADASSEDDATQQHGAQGDMPRGQRFGYIFGGGGDLGWLLAHELGHGVFTLKHLNEANYAGAGSLGTLANLMDYTGSTALAAFQWNIIANPAILTALDSDEASKAVAVDLSTYDKKMFEKLSRLGNDYIVFGVKNTTEISEKKQFVKISDNSYYVFKLNKNEKGEIAPKLIDNVEQFVNEYKTPNNLEIQFKPISFTSTKYCVLYNSIIENQITHIFDETLISADKTIELLTSVELEGNLKPLFERITKYDTEVSQVARSIQAKLDNDFYGNVKVKVLLESQIGHKLELLTKGLQNGSDAELTINITYKTSTEKPIFKLSVSEGYLSEYVQKWQAEAGRRGLNVDVESLRLQVKRDIESQEFAVSTWDDLCQTVSSFLSEQVGSFVESIQATQKIAKNVWDKGEINRSTWHSSDSEHILWPKYVQFNPAIGGVTDGVIDEIVGIPMAIKGVYGLVTDADQRAALGNLFTKEGLSSAWEGMKDELVEMANDSERLTHFGSKTTVQAVFMFTGVNVAGKFVDVAKDAIKLAPSAKATHILNKLKKANRYDPKQIDALNKLLGKIDPKVLDKLAACDGFEAVLNDMVTQWSKFHGGKFQLEYASLLVKQGKRISFEVVDEGSDLVRRYDIVNLDFPFTRFELKNWSNFHPETIRNQFVKDLAKTKELGDIQWIFNQTGGVNDITTLKTKVMAALKNADGTPIRELDALFTNKSKVRELEIIFDKKNLTPESLLKEVDAKFDVIVKIAE